jgi:tetratricopeptide (TPR) repeat protein
LTQETVLLLKEAEKLSEETADNNLKNKICSALAYLNGVLGNYGESLKYAKKEYFYAKKLNNNRDIAYGLLRLSTNYEISGMKDSAVFCINECNKLVQYINNDDKAFVYNLLGESFMSTDIDSAQKYFVSALTHKKGSTVYKNLMEIYFAKNDSTAAKRYCDSALMLAWTKQKIGIYSQLAQKYYDGNDIADLKAVTDKIISTHNDILVEDQNKFFLELQRKFDFEKQQIIYTRNVSVCISAIIIMFAICIILHLQRKHEKQLTIQKELEWENSNLQLLNDLCEAKRIITDH